MVYLCKPFCQPKRYTGMKVNELFAERFHSARVLNGLSLQDLADRLGNRVSKQALHKYEKGEVLPDSE